MSDVKGKAQDLWENTKDKVENLAERGRKRGEEEWKDLKQTAEIKKDEAKREVSRAEADARRESEKVE